MSRFLAPILFALMCTSPARAALELDLVGGGATQVTTLTLWGLAGQPFLILYSPYEQLTVVNPQVTLEIPVSFASLAVQTPGFLGVLDGAGVAQAQFVIPNLPAVLDLTLSMQAISRQPIDTASNLLRLTPALPENFEIALGAPSVPIAGGDVLSLEDGRLLFVGGSGPVVQSYDPDREEFGVAGVALGAAALGRTTALADGRLLFSGGLGLSGQPTDSAAVYDPTSGQTLTLTMLNPRAGHGASLLPDGRVLITGGFQTIVLTDLLQFLTGVQNSTEIFDPVSLSFAAGPNMLEARALHSSTALTDGKLLVAGGLSVIPIINLPTISNTAYVYNPTFNTFGLPIFFSGARMSQAATLLSDGRILLAGGLSIDFTDVIATGDLTQLTLGTLDDCQLFETTILGGRFSSLPGLSSGRAGAGLVALPDGGALIAGGFSANLGGGGLGFTTLATADRLRAGALSPTGNLAAPRVSPLLTPLADGTVLVVGGGPADAEIYQP